MNINKCSETLLISNINRLWFSGCDTSDGLILITNTKSYYIVDARDSEAIKGKVKVDKIVEINSKDEVIKFIKKNTTKKIMIENNISIEQLNNFIKPLKKPTSIINFKECRIQKNAEEIRLMQKAADIAASTINFIKKTIKPGETEIAVAKRIYIHMLELGADGLSFPPIVAFGENTGNPHHIPGNRKLKKNEFITLDIGCTYKGYCSDITRTFWLGKANQQMKEMYTLIKEAQLLGVQTAGYVKKGCEIDKIVREYIQNNPKYGNMFTHGTGHGVGVEIHEFPYVNKSYAGEILDGSVITIEPGVYQTGVMGVRIEDTIYVKNGKVKVLTYKAPKM